MNSQNTKKPNNNRRSNNHDSININKKKIIVASLIIITIVLTVMIVYAIRIFSSVSGTILDETKLGINPNLDKKIINVALFGIDGREDVEVEGDRTDTIMIASANFETGEIKVVSVMRDLLAKIPESAESDSYYDKINAAYSIGGVQCAVRALNENFDLNISDYVTVDFNCMVDAVNALGGIEINIQNEDVLKWTNKYIGDVNTNTHHSSPPIKQMGVNHVDGVQALAYCRNRYSDSDYGRTERQREVLSVVAQKAMNMDFLTSINLITKIYPYIETSFTLSELKTYYSAITDAENPNIITGRVPYDQLNSADYIGEISYVIPTTMEDNVIVLHNFLFGVEYYTPSETVYDISNTIATMSGNFGSVDWTTTTCQDILNHQSSVRDDPSQENPEDTTQTTSDQTQTIVTSDMFPPLCNGATRSEIIN